MQPRPLLLLLPLLLVSCAGPKRITMVDGSTTITVEQAGQLGGKDFVHATKSKSGALAITTRTDEEGSFRDGAQAGLAAVGLWQAGLSNRASTASDTAVAVGAQKADVAKSAQAAAVETERIRAAAIPHP